MSKTRYTIKPYQVGLDKRSLADIIPAKIYTERNGSTYSICFGANKHTGYLTLQTENNMVPADKSFKASKAAGISGDPVGDKTHGYHK